MQEAKPRPSIIFQIEPVSMSRAEMRYMGLFPQSLAATELAKPEREEIMMGTAVNAAMAEYGRLKSAVMVPAVEIKAVFMPPTKPTVMRRETRLRSFRQRGQFYANK